MKRDHAAGTCQSPCVHPPIDVLVTLVEAWEWKHYPLDLPDPIEAIKYRMEQNGLQPRDLIPFIGSRNRVHEVLNYRRPVAGCESTCR
jgi:antitoxin component HigA of HigAB toxin-antitoxin module